MIYIYWKFVTYHTVDGSPCSCKVNIKLPGPPSPWQNWMTIVCLAANYFKLSFLITEDMLHQYSFKWCHSIESTNFTSSMNPTSPVPPFQHQMQPSWCWEDLHLLKLQANDHQKLSSAFRENLLLPLNHCQNQNKVWTMVKEEWWEVDRNQELQQVLKDYTKILYAVSVKVM